MIVSRRTKMTKAELALKVKTGKAPKSHLYDREILYLYQNYTVNQLKEMCGVKVEKKVERIVVSEIKDSISATEITDGVSERDMLFQEAKDKGLKPAWNVGVKKLKKMLKDK